MKTVIFDVDGTLIQSFEFDETYYLEATKEVLAVDLNTDWESYTHVTDTGLLMEHLEKQNSTSSIDDIEPKVKKIFIEKIRNHLEREPAEPVPGALDFFHKLKTDPCIALGIATGGWGETAILKLESAGFDISGVPLASSNDHYARIEIMQNANNQIKQITKTESGTPNYFGDAEWDKRACHELGYNFILVGNRTTHQNCIADFSDPEFAKSYIC